MVVVVVVVVVIVVGEGPGSERVVVEGELLEGGEAREEIRGDGGEGISVDVDGAEGSHAGKGGEGPRDLVSLEVEGFEGG